MNNILEIRNVSKHYGNITALEDICLDIEEGSIFGLLGPNGAGKTTLLRILNNILVSDSGNISLCGKPLARELSPLLGYMPEERGLYPKMRVEDQIMFFGQLKGADKTTLRRNMKEYMEIFNVTENSKRKVEELSKGNQQKVQIIATLVHEPKLLVLDEPFSGFDPINGQLLAQLIERLHEKGTTILLSSHNMPAIEEMCSDIALINRGHLLLNGKIEDIKEVNKSGALELTTRVPISIDMAMDSGIFESIEPTDAKKRRKGASYKIVVKPGTRNNDVLKQIAYQGDVLHFEEILPTLNDIFIKYTTSTK